MSLVFTATKIGVENTYSTSAGSGTASTSPATLLPLLLVMMLRLPVPNGELAARGLPLQLLV